ncbi:MAG: SusC/RagA family TonB-linked outer membrane protein [Odoribacteraceae bacterium]|jgi:TonB-linked SusC/RagA family outer membrane protein|nr:SusC/RagA family TonB-linked outer membrane protein [Odoribacteraceae bacterium]
MKKTVDFGGFVLLKLPRMFIIMKTWIVILFVCSFNLNAEIFAQQERLDISMKGAPLAEVFRQIRQASNYAFVYDSDAIKQQSPVNVSVKGASIEQVLDLCLDGTGFSYVIEDNIVIIRAGQPARQQPVKVFRVSGVVTDVRKLPLPGVNIQLKESTQGVSTDVNGRYTFAFPEVSKPVLVFSFIGMRTREVVYAGEETLDIVLEEDAQSLADVVVTGIFNRRGESYTGSVRTITDVELKQFRGRNIFATLSNIDPAFNIIPNNDWGNDPNRLPEIQIRGAGSIPNINQLQDQTSVSLNTPLFILDGFETTQQRMMDLNDSEVKSIVLLKDGQATALYGSRGANGVVVITTKEPEPGHLRLTYSGFFNVNVPDLTSYHLLNARDKLELERLSNFYESDTKDAARNIGMQQYYNQVLAEVIRGVDTYWLSKPLRTGVDQNHNLRLEGGDQSFRYSLSAQLHDIQGVMKGSGRNVFNGGVDLSYKHTALLFRNSLQIGYTRWQESPYGNFSEYAKLNPYWTPYDDDGKLVQYFTPYNWDYMTQTGRYHNPYPNPMYNATLNTYDKSSTTTLTNNFSVEWIPVEWLIMRGGVGISGTVSDRDNFKPENHSDFSEYSDEDLIRKGSHDYSDGRAFRYTANFAANYSRLINGQHRVFVGLNTEMSQDKSRTYDFKVEGFPDEGIDFLAAGLQYPEGGSPGGGESTSRRVGFGISGNYTYMDRYLFDISYNTEGSSQFGTNRRFAPFFSLGVGWNLHHESFFNGALPFVDRWKWRATFGSTGSQQFNAYQALDTYRYYTNDRYKGWIGAYQVALGNKDLEWQKTDKYNVGFDLEIFNRRLMLTVDAYVEKTDNLLSSLELPYSNGFTEYTENIGKVENRGFELRATAWLLNDTKNRVAWSVTGNLAHNRDKITKLSEAMKAANEALAATLSSVPVKIVREGDSQNTIYVVRSLGIDPSTGEELYLNNEGEITYTWRSNYQVAYGNSQPKYRGNFSTFVRYKNLSLNASFGYLWGGQKYNSTLVDKVENADKIMNVDERVLKDRWIQPGDKTFFRRLNATMPVYYSSRFVQDESVFTCQNVNIAYELFGTPWLNRFGARSLTLSANTGELFYISTIRRERGIEYPFTRQFSMSMSVIF